MTENITHIRFSTIGGTIFSAWFYISSDDLIKTTVMASFGAVVSYLVSLLMKRIHHMLRQNKKK